MLLEPEAWSSFTSGQLGPAAEAEQRELLTTLQHAVEDVLTPHQRRVLVALALNGVPIDVLAERLDDARRALQDPARCAPPLRAFLDERDLTPDDWKETS